MRTFASFVTVRPMFRKLFARKGPTTPSGPEVGRGRTAKPRRQHCYIKFAVASPTGLERLTLIVEAFKADKTAAMARPDEEWASSFSKEELAAFWRPDADERQAWEAFWFSTPLPRRHSAEMPSPGWHFESMLEAILENGDYDLIGVRAVGDGEAVLEFDPHGYPYGGTGALRALIRAFSHRVIGADDGTGYEDGDPQPPRWTPENRVKP